MRVQEAAAATIVALVLSLSACRSSSPSPAGEAARGAAPPADARDGGRAHVQLSWRLFETQRWMEGSAHRESAVVQVLVNGGAPAQVDLGRRDTAGCAIAGPPADDFEGAITTLACRAAGAQVLRSGPGELRIVASDRAPSGDPARLREAAVAVQIPPGADVAVDRELSRVPDEAQ
ncbi:MAG TPA: hypothetical protein VHV30_18000 [Polyangiaceae bacterium]|nr:hypothetical protein [Polyangiaceae bacterium]